MPAAATAPPAIEKIVDSVARECACAPSLPAASASSWVAHVVEPPQIAFAAFHFERASAPNTLPVTSPAPPTPIVATAYVLRCEVAGRGCVGVGVGGLAPALALAFAFGGLLATAPAAASGSFALIVTTWP